MTDTDPRIRQLAEARYRNGYGAWCEDAWDTLDAALRQQLTNEAAAWLSAAVEAGLMPHADRPTDDHDAVYVDDAGFLYGEYQVAPRTDEVYLLRLQWVDEMAVAKSELEEQGAVFQFLGWST